MSRHRIAPAAGWVHDYTRLPRGPNGRALCRRCGTEVPKGSRTFCSAACIHEWRVRSDPGYARVQVEKRDHGVCALCGRDTEALAQKIRAWLTVDRDDYMVAVRRRNFLARCVRGWYRTLWQADHTVPVCEGGGECGLDNYRTLCLPCHRRVTAELRQRLAARPRQATLALDKETA